MSPKGLKETTGICFSKMQQFYCFYFVLYLSIVRKVMWKCALDESGIYIIMQLFLPKKLINMTNMNLSGMCLFKYGNLTIEATYTGWPRYNRTQL